MRINDKELFAASVVNSSSPSLSVEEKLKLFLKAKELAEKHNKDQGSPKASIGVWKD